MKRSEITELYLGLVRATISIKFVDTFQRNTAFPISLSPSSYFDKRRKGNPKHKIMGKTYKPSQVQWFLCPI